MAVTAKRDNSIGCATMCALIALATLTIGGVIGMLAMRPHHNCRAASTCPTCGHTDATAEPVIDTEGFTIATALSCGLCSTVTWISHVTSAEWPPHPNIVRSLWQWPPNRTTRSAA